jgi:riboflavin synthase
MFTGIIESKSKILEHHTSDQSLSIFIDKPKIFNDLKTGDSIAVNGVCLTLESDHPQKMKFTLGFETLKVLHLHSEENKNKFLFNEVNLERSLRFGDRIHGHLVTGHVDALGVINKKKWEDVSLVLWIRIPKVFQSWVWPKGSICLNGVSLTVNSMIKMDDSSAHNFDAFNIEVCLIPETIQRTNLSNLELNDFINIEFDYYAKAIVNYEQNKI